MIGQDQASLIIAEECVLDVHDEVHQAKRVQASLTVELLAQVGILGHSSQKAVGSIFLFQPGVPIDHRGVIREQDECGFEKDPQGENPIEIRNQNLPA